MKYRFSHRTITVLPFACASLAMVGIMNAPARGKSKTPAPKAGQQAPTPGKYGCTTSRYNSATQSYEITPRGSFTIAADKSYRYHGFSKPSAGRYRFDAGSGKISFLGGYFDKGEATPIAGEKNRYYLTTPTLPDNRWTCSLTDQK